MASAVRAADFKSELHGVLESRAAKSRPSEADRAFQLLQLAVEYLVRHGG